MKRANNKKKEKKSITGFRFAFFGVFSILGCVVFFISVSVFFVPFSAFLPSTVCSYVCAGFFFQLYVLSLTVPWRHSIRLCVRCDFGFACTRLFSAEVLAFVCANHRIHSQNFLKVLCSASPKKRNVLTKYTKKTGRLIWISKPECRKRYAKICIAISAMLWPEVQRDEWMELIYFLFFFNFKPNSKCKCCQIISVFFTLSWIESLFGFTLLKEDYFGMSI